MVLLVILQSKVDLTDTLSSSNVLDLTNAHTHYTPTQAPRDTDHLSSGSLPQTTRTHAHTLELYAWGIHTSNQQYIYIYTHIHAKKELLIVWVNVCACVCMYVWNVCTSVHYSAGVRSNVLTYGESTRKEISAKECSFDARVDAAAFWCV